jgi:lysophospholipase L1-like esterase
MFKRLFSLGCAALALLSLPAVAQTPTTTRVDVATPAAVSARPGASVAITLNWYRVRTPFNTLQFMHLVNASGAQWSVDDHWTTSASWTSGVFSEVRTITVPAGLANGNYDIRVGLSGGNPWVDYALGAGAGVTDPGNDRRYKVGTLTVSSVVANVAPQITSTAPTSATVGAAYAYRVAATDANGDVLSYALTQAPTGMTINTTSGQIAWTPTTAQVGAHAVTARVTDPGGLAATQSFTVTASSANVAPQITSTAIASATVGAAYAYRVTATDANGDALSYSLTQAPSGMTINPTSGQIAWTPSAAQAGIQAVTARVADPGGLAATQAFSVTVADPTALPQPQIGNSWRIMPIGDSNTENLAASPGYQVITQALGAIGKSSAVFGYVNPGEPNIVRQVTAPQIGRSGWSTGDVLPQINGWVDQVTPDIVLLNIGINDGYFPNDSAAQDAVVGRIATIIERIHARNPRTAVMVSNFERASDAMPAMSTKIQQMVAAKMAGVGRSIYYNVFFVPSLTGVTGSMYTSDGLHPNESARILIMNNWMNAVRSYVQNGTVTAPPPPSNVPLTTRVDQATPSAYYARPGSRVDIKLNWYRMPMAANLLQFMHLSVNGNMIASVDDHWTTSASWAQGLFAQTRTITAPTALGTYDIRVGLSGGNPWTDYPLVTGPGVTDEWNARTYKVGTLVVTQTPP